MITPEPVSRCCPVETLIVTTLGPILAAAALMLPSILAAGAACVLNASPADAPSLSVPRRATVPAPTPPPTTAATTAVASILRRPLEAGEEPPSTEVGGGYGGVDGGG